MLQPHAKITENKDGVITAVSPIHQLTVFPDGKSKVFNRNAKRINETDPTKQEERWLVGELDGVRVYINGTHFIMTKQDLYP